MCEWKILYRKYNWFRKEISWTLIWISSDFTKGNLPVKLIYYEEYERIDLAFRREKQIQGWSRKKKEALIKGKFEELPELSKSKKKREGCWAALL